MTAPADRFKLGRSWEGSIDALLGFDAPKTLPQPADWPPQPPIELEIVLVDVQRKIVTFNLEWDEWSE